MMRRDFDSFCEWLILVYGRTRGIRALSATLAFIFGLCLLPKTRLLGSRLKQSN